MRWWRGVLHWMFWGSNHKLLLVSTVEKEKIRTRGSRCVSSPFRHCLWHGSWLVIAGYYNGDGGGMVTHQDAWNLLWCIKVIWWQLNTYVVYLNISTIYNERRFFKNEKIYHRLKTCLHLEPITLLLGTGWTCQGSDWCRKRQTGNWKRPRQAHLPKILTSSRCYMWLRRCWS